MAPRPRHSLLSLATITASGFTPSDGPERLCARLGEGR